MNPNEDLITKFYTAFSNSDLETMVQCYHTDIEFKDPAFGILKGDEVPAMWELLILKGKGQIKIEFSGVNANAEKGTVKWIASYNFSKTNRKVINKIDTNFEFKDGLIIRHTDSFDIWRWSQQALGLPGYLLGWTPFLQKKIQRESTCLLKKFSEKKS